MNDGQAKTDTQDKQKHLYILDRINSQDTIIGELKRLIQDIQPSDAKEAQQDPPSYQEMSLHAFLTETPTIMDEKQDRLYRLIMEVRDLVL